MRSNPEDYLNAKNLCNGWRNSLSPWGRPPLRSLADYPMIAMPISAGEHGLSDEEIVSRVLGGDTAVFEIWMRRYNQLVYRGPRARFFVKIPKQKT
jgi:hypothetical protein